jgi:aspartyl protease family protein
MSQAPGKRAGRVLMVLAWAAALFLATRFFGQWEERQQNPNRRCSPSRAKVLSKCACGQWPRAFRRRWPINGQVVHFMLDTGATDVAIPRRWPAT